MDEYIYILYDRVALGRTGNVVTNRSDAVVVRLFQDLLASDERMAMHADDYEMRRVGSISESGWIEPEESVTIATGAQWRASRVPQVMKEEKSA